MYGSEAWTLSITLESKLEAFEMCLRGIRKISWKDRLTNDRVLDKRKAEINLCDTQKRKWSYYGHKKRRKPFWQLQWKAKFKAEEQEGDPVTFGLETSRSGVRWQPRNAQAMQLIITPVECHCTSALEEKMSLPGNPSNVMLFYLLDCIPG